MSLFYHPFLTKSITFKIQVQNTVYVPKPSYDHSGFLDNRGGRIGPKRCLQIQIKSMNVLIGKHQPLKYVEPKRCILIAHTAHFFFEFNTMYTI